MNMHLRCGQCHGVTSHKRSCNWQALPLEGQLRADARALWAVRVLDAWAAWHVCSLQIGRKDVPERMSIMIGDLLAKAGLADIDAARHAAALAVFPSLDRNAPNWPGECP